ncbi:hypothetical protein EK21DRAFT_76430 [Setomelanomma holmii]|uniref:Uncharacterized protein n=1 Tax=Setomelanomma holmii TaxID=210430 RepID=A0A9P4H172_9PLEO|nr:hypothetical protein EK21DRAFT_76430 [Setomelanomma holmii]
MDTTSEPNLVRLPREIRDLIYPYVLPTRLQLAPIGSEQNLSFHDTNGIFLVNHQLRSEVHEVFYRLFAITTIVVPRDQWHALVNPSGRHLLRQNIINLVLPQRYRKRMTRGWVFSLASNYYGAIKAMDILDNLPNLQNVTYEIEWAPNDAPAVLLPHMKESILQECRRVTIGTSELTGWDVECRIRDEARWKNEWSGTVSLRKVRD